MSVRNVWGPRWQAVDLKSWGIRVASRLAYQRADRIVVAATDIGDELVNLFGIERQKIRVIHNPIDIDAIRKLASEPHERMWLTEAASPVIVAVGALTEQKNHRDLLLALAQVRENVDARLVILGSGPQADPLKQLARELGLSSQVSMPGVRVNPYSLMAAADVFVLPSSWEGCPNVLLEALALGISIVATDCPGASAELLGHGRWGTLVSPRDVRALAAGISEALRSKRPRNDVPPASPRAFDFTPTTIARRYLEVLDLAP